MFYESVYELDDVERPSEDIINNDIRLDKWEESRRERIRQQLVSYHKNTGGQSVDTGIPMPLRMVGSPDD